MVYFFIDLKYTFSYRPGYCFFSALSEVANDYFSGLLIILGVMLILILSSLFVLVCQFNLRKYLKQKNASLMNSLVDSIGNNTENSE